MHLFQPEVHSLLFVMQSGAAVTLEIVWSDSSAIRWGSVQEVTGIRAGKPSAGQGCLPLQAAPFPYATPAEDPLRSHTELHQIRREQGRRRPSRLLHRWSGHRSPTLSGAGRGDCLDEILFNHKEGNPALCKNMDGPRGHYAK